MIPHVVPVWVVIVYPDQVVFITPPFSCDQEWHSLPSILLFGSINVDHHSEVSCFYFYIPTYHIFFAPAPNCSNFSYFFIYFFYSFSFKYPAISICVKHVIFRQFTCWYQVYWNVVIKWLDGEFFRSIGW